MPSGPPIKISTRQLGEVTILDLVGDITLFNSPQIRKVLLQLLRDEWTRTDAVYTVRIDHLTNGGGLNGSYVLNKTTISDDSSNDTLTGGLGSDWFIIAKKKDTVTDQNVPLPEIVTTL